MVYTSFFSEEAEYNARVMLRSYQDAILCLQQAAEKEVLQKKYENISNRLILHLKQKQMFKKSIPDKNIQRDIRIFQFSHFIFLKYFPEFDAFTGKYEDLLGIMMKGNKLIDDKIQEKLSGKLKI